MALQVSSSTLDMNIKSTNLAKIESFFNDSSYRELIDHSASFNARLSHERKLRLPFLDPQTGVAQKHSTLHFKKSQRLPGLRLGQIYTYPSTRWRCSKRASFTKYSSHPFYRFRAADNCSTINNNTSTNHHNSTITTAVTSAPPASAAASVLADNGESQELVFPDESNSMTGDTDSKDSQIIKDDTLLSSKDWYYDDILDSADVGSEEQGDSDFEFSLNGYKKKKRAPAARKLTSRKPKAESDGVKKSRSTSSGNRSSGSGGGATTANRSRKSTSKSTKSKGGKSSDKKSYEPPSFDSVQSEYMDGSGDGFGSYRSF